MRTTALVCWLLVVSAGCRSVVTFVSPAQDLSRLPPRTLLLTDSDHSVIRMTYARLTGDTIMGMVRGQWTALPLSHLTEVRAVIAAPARTAVLAVGVGGAAVLAVLAIKHAAPNGPEVCYNADPPPCL